MKVTNVSSVIRKAEISCWPETQNFEIFFSPYSYVKTFSHVKVSLLFCGPDLEIRIPVYALVLQNGMLTSAQVLSSQVKLLVSQISFKNSDQYITSVFRFQ
jgi:hypothetical protein